MENNQGQTTVSLIHSPTQTRATRHEVDQETDWKLTRKPWSVPYRPLLFPADYPALRAWRDTARDFHLPEQLLVTVASPGGLVNPTTRALLEQLQTELTAVPGVVAH